MVDTDEFDGVVDKIEENSNKKATYFVVDGAECMFLDDPSGLPYGPQCSFGKAIKAIYEMCVKLCVTEEALKHLVGVLVINTKDTETNSDFDFGAENMKHIFPICTLDREKVLILEDIISQFDYKEWFFKEFGGHTRCSYQRLGSYSKLNIAYSGSSRRFTSWIHFTKQLNPFSADFLKDGEYRRMLRNLQDIEGRAPVLTDAARKPLKGRCSIFILGDQNSCCETDLRMWRTIDAEADIYQGDFENLLIRRTGAVRSHAVVPFQLAPGFEFNVNVYSLVAKKVKPTPFKIHSLTGKIVQSRTNYVTPNEETDEFANSKNFTNFPLERHELAHMREIGGEQVVLMPGDRDIHLRYPKGLKLLRFVPIERIDIWRHVRAPWVIRPHESSHVGAISFYSHLLQRLEARNLAAVCEFTGRANQRPRNVALLPSSSHDPEQGIHKGFVIVELHDSEDELDIQVEFEEKLKAPENEDGVYSNPSQRSVNAAINLCQSLLKKRFTPAAYPNPHLQAFYAMLKSEAGLGEAIQPGGTEWESAKEEWDHLKPWFKNSTLPESRVSKALLAAKDLARSTDIEDWDPEAKAIATKRRGAEEKDNASPRKNIKSDPDAKTDDIDLFAYVQNGRVSQLTVAALKNAAAEAGISLESLKKKADIIDKITQHYT